MSSAAPQLVDPLAALIAREFARDGRLLPHVDLAFDVEIAGGLALVRTVRTFHHSEENSLEAILVFPVPLRAALFRLEVEIDGRRLTARATGRAEARNDYEGAISSGRTTVLHEEVLRGVHMLSVGHLPAGRKVVVETSFAMALAAVADGVALHIPLTVGDIYGDPRLPDTDRLEHAPRRGQGRLRVRCREGRVRLSGQPLGAGWVDVPLDAPIDLRVEGWRPAAVVGRAADGRRVVVDIRPRTAGDDALDLVILLDRSGSMGELASGNGSRETKYAAAIRALAAATGRMRHGDRVELWQFDHACSHIGSIGPQVGASRARPSTVTRRFRHLLRRLGEPRGGTELGRAIARVLDESSCRDVLVITDGKSWELDVDDLARRGKRISVVLVGEDSLEARIGHLAILTGGDVCLALDGAVEEGLRRALAGLRTPASPARVEGELDGLDAVLGGMQVRAKWTDAPQDGSERSVMEQAVSAFAASLALPALAPERARQLAMAEALVTHRTSLVLVDEEGEVQEALPRTVKIPLATPRTARDSKAFYSFGPRIDPAGGQRPDAAFLARRSAPRPMRPLAFDVWPAPAPIDWMGQSARLLRGDLSELDPELAEAVRAFAAMEEVVRLAGRLGLAPVLLVLYLLAGAEAERDRFARRFARRLLPSPTPAQRAEIGRLQRTLPAVCRVAVGGAPSVCRTEDEEKSLRARLRRWLQP